MGRWEIQWFDDGAWHTDGFDTVAGFVPYRYENRTDAERQAKALHPGCSVRAVPATSVVGEKA